MAEQTPENEGVTHDKDEGSDMGKFIEDTIIPKIRVSGCLDLVKENIFRGGKGYRKTRLVESGGNYYIELNIDFAYSGINELDVSQEAKTRQYNNTGIEIKVAIPKDAYEMLKENMEKKGRDIEVKAKCIN